MNDYLINQISLTGNSLKILVEQKLTRYKFVFDQVIDQKDDIIIVISTTDNERKFWVTHEINRIFKMCIRLNKVRYINDKNGKYYYIFISKSKLLR